MAMLVGDLVDLVAIPTHLPEEEEDSSILKMPSKCSKSKEF